MELLITQFMIVSSSVGTYLVNHVGVGVEVLVDCLRLTPNDGID